MKALMVAETDGQLPPEVIFREQITTADMDPQYGYDLKFADWFLDRSPRMPVESATPRAQQSPTSYIAR